MIDKSQHLAVVGVSADKSKFGHRIFADLKKSGYSVFAVNPRGGTVEGEEVYASLSELPLKPELVIVVVPPEITVGIVNVCVKLGIKNIWMQPGAESAEAVVEAEKAGITVVQNACFMVRQGIW